MKLIQVNWSVLVYGLGVVVFELGQTDDIPAGLLG